ncbi:lipopolysaccharide assembly protein LapA domain-containing protein [Gordonia sp. ABSL11-1]|uniref:LapA family protein n=1 Tax=Gordonia sp. ABSL11-1 TaxID=3053924 RepID=UPI0025726110|nr:lipopolysaccharide assembly protein LapA domain-containing protein [Gordonia sp. ABSL11-1]MDL9944747.1 lipopolysaccharide assembly protein LapA domain-containing protein [Gordonia sp. ABSL11-1]
MTTPDPHQPEFEPIEPTEAGAGDPTDPEHQALLAERDKLRTQVKKVEHTRARATFFGLVIGAIITILLLVFILQNMESQRIELLFWEVNLPLGVSLLIAAIAGALIVALAGGVRMVQMSRALRKAKK